MNRYLSSRALLVLGLGLILVACDSGGGDNDPDALLGLWDGQESTSRILATVTQAQQTIDRTQPGQGGLQITGAETGMLHYYGYRSTSGNSESVTISSFDFRGNEPSSRLYYLDLTRSANASSMRLDVYDGGDSQSYHLDSETPLYTFENNVLTVNGAALSDGSDTVILDGTLTFATRSLPANQEVEIDVYTYDGEEEGFRLEFADNNILRIYEEDDSETGSWAIVGDQLRLTFEDGEEDDTILTSYQISGNTLSMNFIEDDCADDDEYEQECLAYYEMDYDLEPGTLTRVREENRLTMTRASGGNARPSAGVSAHGERPNARPWPTRPAPMQKGAFGMSR